ncbi:MAG: hypothetical protein M1823_006047 [Watsoniomyces obsoletus]|nr:MAG: hypothetical protein M1823_006047 [Watsoniomyces obsoletus]
MAESSDTSTRPDPSIATSLATEPMVAQNEVGVATSESTRAEDDSAQLQRAWPPRIHSTHPNTTARTYGHAGPPGSAGFRISPPTAARLADRRGGNARRAGDGHSPGPDSSRIQSIVTSGPQRPSYVPSLDSSRTMGLNNFAPRPAQDYWEDNNVQRSPGHPVSRAQHRSGSIPSPHGQPVASSWRSTQSTNASIPDFPYPGLVTSPRKSGHAGAAQATRKGSSSYYSQYSYVSPIPEEDPTASASHGSFASSRVIPSSWGSGLSDYVPNPDVAEDGRGGHRGAPGPSRLREEDEVDSMSASEFIMSYHRSARGGPSMQQSEGNIQTALRQQENSQTAEQTQENIQTVQQPDQDSPLSDIDPQNNDDMPGPLNASSPRDERTQVGDPAGHETTVPALQFPQRTLSPRRPGVTTPTRDLRSTTPGEQYDTASSMRRTHSARSSQSGSSRAPILPTDDPRAQQIWYGVQKGTSLADQSTSGANRSRAGGVTSPGGQSSRRPSRPSPDPSKEPEIRSSLTSLPELIKRATRLASVLDRGRPNSRVTLDSPQEKDEHRDMRATSPPGRKPASIADMLAYFPTPGTREGEGAVSQSSGYPGRAPRGTKPADHSSRYQSRSRARKKDYGRRKICGIPFWSFIVLMAMAGIIVIAAVILPVTFVVIIPRQNRPQVMSIIGDCQRRLPCLNGGTNVLEGGTCRCICVSGFTGDRCANAPTGSCVTADFRTETANLQGVTVGSAIPRLLQQGQRAFNIPLSVSLIIGAFSNANQSCNLQNALVTFNGRSVPESSPNRNRPRKRQILTANNPPPVPATSTFRGATASPTNTNSNNPPSSTPTSTPSAPPLINDESAIDFARVSVLYILQRSDMEKAVYAQHRLQNFLGNSTTPGGGSRVTIGDGVGVDLRERTIIFVNGTVVGGGGTGRISS